MQETQNILHKHPVELPEGVNEQISGQTQGSEVTCCQSLSVSVRALVVSPF